MAQTKNQTPCRRCCRSFRLQPPPAQDWKRPPAGAVFGGNRGLHFTLYGSVMHWNPVLRYICRYYLEVIQIIMTGYFRLIGLKVFVLDLMIHL